MPFIERIDENGTVVGRHELVAGLLQEPVNVGLLHQVVTAELASHRQGTAAAKTKHEVSGSTRKLWRQKGTGRARAGSSKVPQFTGGGVAFPPIPRSYAQKINKKARAAAYRMALADLVVGGSVRVLTAGSWEEPSTKKAASLLAKAGLTQPILVLAGSEEVNVLKSFRNLAGIRALPVTEAEVQDYVWARSLLFTEAAVAFLESGVQEGGES